MLSCLAFIFLFWYKNCGFSYFIKIEYDLCFTIYLADCMSLGNFYSFSDSQKHISLKKLGGTWDSTKSFHFSIVLIPGQAFSQFPDLLFHPFIHFLTPLPPSTFLFQQMNLPLTLLRKPRFTGGNYHPWIYN